MTTTATPIFDTLVQEHPLPATAVDATFHWTAFEADYHRLVTVPASKPRPGARPTQKRKKR